MRYNFKDRVRVDYRAQFANDILQLVYDKHNGNMSFKMMAEVGEFNSYLEGHVRNIYEVTDSEIPLLAYFELHKYEADNWDFTKEEHEAAIARTKEAVIEYHQTWGGLEPL